MGILVTGAKGFVGQNLVSSLKNNNYEVYEYDINSDLSELEEFIEKTDFVFHLAGVNRPKDEKDFMEGNFGFTKTLLELLEKKQNKSPIVITSSIQAKLDNPYGKSKKAGEDFVFSYGEKNNVKTYVYRLPNLFGKWCRPNYNSAVATFCNNIANDLPITVSDENNVVNLLYIDDLINDFISHIDKEKKIFTGKDYLCPEPVYNISLGELVELIYSFKKSRENLFVPLLSKGFEKKLYSTFLSYLPTDSFIYDLKQNTDERGSFTEFLKSPERGQVSVNISKPGITKGNHWHHTKVEKFLVVSGEGIIKFRKIDSEEIFEYKVNGNKLQVVDIPPGYTHNIINTGENDLVTIMWVNEPFNKDEPDTYFLPV